MRIIILLIISMFVVKSGFGQKTLKIHSNPENTKNSVIWYLKYQNGQFGATNTRPLYNRPDFVAQEWTWNGARGTHKSLIQFNISSIPKSSKIKKATLSLYAYPNSQSCNGHRTLSGSNECYLERITEYWNPYTCCWNNQPSVTKKNRVILKKSKTNADDYLDIDVTKLVQDMVNEPQKSFGFRISLISKQHYRAMAFASPNHKNSKKHPVLTIKYKKSKKEQKKLSNKEFKFEKEPEIEIVEVKEKKNSRKESLNHSHFEISDNQNYKVLKYSINSPDTIYINKNQLQKGTYKLKVYEENKITTKTIIIK